MSRACLLLCNNFSCANADSQKRLSHLFLLFRQMSAWVLHQLLLFAMLLPMQMQRLPHSNFYCAECPHWKLFDKLVETLDSSQQLSIINSGNITIAGPVCILWTQKCVIVLELSLHCNIAIEVHSLFYKDAREMINAKILFTSNCYHNIE